MIKSYIVKIENTKTGYCIKNGGLYLFEKICLLLKLTFSILILLIELFDDEQSDDNALPSNYNYRTGELDLTKLNSGIYDKDI